MYLFGKIALPFTLIITMVIWAWISFLSVAVSSLL